MHRDRPSSPTPSPPDRDPGPEERTARSEKASLRASVLAGVAGLLCLLAATWIGFRLAAGPSTEEASSGPPPAPRLVVLPLIDLEGAGDRYFADGVTDEIAAGLAAVEGLEVRGRVSAASFTDVNRDAAEIGRRLGGAAVVDGTIRRAAGRVRLSVRLLDSSEGTVLWSLAADTSRDRLFDLRDRVVGGVASALGLEVSDRTGRRLERRRTSGEAFDLYLLGRFRWAARAGGDLAEAAAFYHLAIEADSGFAPAWVALAEAYATLPRFTRLPADAARREGAAAARTALQLDPDAAGGHAVLGEILGLYGRDPAGGRSHLERARQLDPGDAWPRQGLCELRLVEGRLDAARQACAEARARDPLAFRTGWLSAEIERASGDTGAALLRLDSLAGAFPDFEPLAGDLALTRLASGDTTAALREDVARWFALLGDAGVADSLATTLHRLLSSAGGASPDRASGATAAVLERVGRELDPSPVHLASLAVSLGEPDAAADAAVRALAEGSPGALRLGVFPEYAMLRRREDVAKALAEAGLPAVPERQAPAGESERE